MSESQQFERVAARAVFIAKERRHELATLEHLLSALLEHEDVQQAMDALKVERAKLSRVVEAILSSDLYSVRPDPLAPDEFPPPTRDLHAVLTRTASVAMLHSKTAGPLDILLNILMHPKDDSPAVTALVQAGLTALALKRFMAHGIAPSGGSVARRGDALPHGDAPPSQAEGEPTSREEAEKFLAKFTTNLNERAKASHIDPLIGREAEVAQIVRITARRTKNNVVMVGEPGVGKTAIAEGLALKITRGEVPEILRDATVYGLEIGSLVAGTRYRGDFEERMKLVLKALALVPNSILFIDEIHTIMEAGATGKGSLDVANLIKPALAKGELRCIGSTTLEEYRKHFEKDRALVRRFKRVDIDEPSIADAKLILRGLRGAYEKHHGVSYTEEALDAAVELTAKYVHGALLPDKAIDVLDNAGARQRVAPPEDRKTVVGLAEIEAEVSAIARIPVSTMNKDESDKLATLESDLRAAVFGQDEAITALGDAVFIARAGLRDPNKPAGSYLFTGPTGVGKTEVAKRLAKTLGLPLHRFDMSEYMEKHAVAKLIGAPPGYVGYGEGGAGNGLLVNAIDKSPSCVLLLDEIEKAHQDVYNILLQVMDDGRLTNSAGKEVPFRNVILIMTSNAGASGLDKAAIGFSKNEIVGEIDDKAINRFFTPEFRNRLDGIIKFNRLRRENMLMIVDKFIAHLNTLAAERGVRVEVDDAARSWLAEKGYDPKMGARPLSRVIDVNLKKPLSRLMLTGPLKAGGKAMVTVEDGALVLHTRAARKKRDTSTA